MSFARFAVINDERGLILGQDFCNFFDKGVVYEANEILGTILIKKIGKYALPHRAIDDELNVGACEYSDANQQVHAAAHLFTIEEYKQMQNNRTDND